jgi:hypothetical protein
MKSRQFLKVLSCFILIVLTFGCAQNPNYEVLANRVIKQTAEQLRLEKDLRAIGTVGQMMGDIQLLGIEFYYYHLVNLSEARELLVYASQVFLKNINENKEVRPYLHNYPFTLKNIDVTIFVSQPNGQDPPQGDIEIITLRSDKIIYKLTAPSEFAPWPVLHEETYEEALKIVGENL